MARPQLWVLAGGNGAGKTTYFDNVLKPLQIAFVNADLLAQQLYADDGEAHSYEAADLAGRIRFSMVKEQKSFCFETVFSHSSKVDFIAAAKAAGYEIILVFIHLRDVKLNKARVAQRVLAGGHNVPARKISSRIPRTLRNIKEAIPLCDRVYLLDNSSLIDPFRPVASIANGVVTVHGDTLPDWAQGLI